MKNRYVIDLRARASVRRAAVPANTTFVSKHLALAEIKTQIAQTAAGL
jgi:hypothetical protein